ncbi:hypothetical protein ACFY2W_23250 [Streptomyces sp. NPDC001262]|uniref:hypothetical protein n=1 Tax=Streptomyces sp. NPDC001262 TaxID=3364552 RepID=UPI0036759344
MAAVPLDLLDRIRELERQVRELAGRAQIRPALNTINHGTVTIGEGGQLFVRQPSGSIIFGVGQNAEGGDWSTGLFRQDGTVALGVGGNITGPDDRQMIRIWSRTEDALLSDDAHAPGHLGRPWIPFPLHPTAYAVMDTNTDWQYAWIGAYPVQNPVLVLSLATYASAGGEVRVNYGLRAETPSTVATWTANAGKWTIKNLALPMHRTRWGDTVTVQVEHRNSAGNGGMQTRLFSSYTRGTVNANEAPDAPRAVNAAAAPAPFTTPDTAPNPSDD